MAGGGDWQTQRAISRKYQKDEQEKVVPPKAMHIRFTTWSQWPSFENPPEMKIQTSGSGSRTREEEEGTLCNQISYLVRYLVHNFSWDF